VASNGFAYLFGRLVITAIFYLAKNREVVFLDIRKANLIFGFCLYCIFVKNTIYVLEIDMLRPALLARYLQSSPSFLSIEKPHPSTPQCIIVH